MLRDLQAERPGAMDHVPSRGGQREDIFPGNAPRHDFIKTVAEAPPR